MHRFCILTPNNQMVRLNKNKYMHFLSMTLLVVTTVHKPKKIFLRYTQQSELEDSLC